MNLQALSLGLYVHIPFCSNACAYCHFLKMTPTPERLAIYFKKLEAEIAYWQTQLPHRYFETIFWGGGSPSCLSCDALNHLSHLFIHASKPKEWTVEVSPINITLEKLNLLKNIGVSRISMGVQSFNPNILKQLGRQQTPQQVFQSYDNIRKAGFKNVNLDLIFPPDFSSIEIWKQDLQTALSLQPEHISTYCLSYENETGPFSKDHYKYVDETKEATFYEFTWQFLADQGYQHYEVSNFSKPGFECLHNLNTWRMQEWIGYGPSAASQLKLKRFQNAFNLNDWQPNSHINIVELTEFELFQDCLIFGLRMNEGICLKKLQQRFPSIDLNKYLPLWEYFCQKGWIYFEDQHIRCTSQGLLLADSLALEILTF